MILLNIFQCFPSKESDMKASMEATKKECAALNSVSLDDVMKGKNFDPAAPATENMMASFLQE